LRAATSEIPWSVTGQVAALVVVVEAVVGATGSTPPGLGAALVVVALAAGSVASLLNNLPASVVLAGLIGGAGLPAYAALIGLAVGALGTPHGSVATMIALERGGLSGHRRYLALWLPTAVVATTVAALALHFSSM
jgi:Na+/H+ antiporter NhaD/arsenite permease-like protein